MTSAPVALLFGSEKFGLSNEDISQCHWLMRIPSRAEHGSMNLGQAVAICLYELRREESAAELPAYTLPETAPAASLTRLSGVMMKLLEESGYAQERTAESTEQKLNRMLRRLHISAHDSEILLGMFRQMLWRRRKGPEQ
jgi:tRNA/rRNA methyltransferase